MRTIATHGSLHVVAVNLNGKTYLVVAETEWDEDGLTVNPIAIGTTLHSADQDLIKIEHEEAIFEAVEAAEQEEMDRQEREALAQEARDADESWQHCDVGVFVEDDDDTDKPPEDDIPF